MSQQLPYSESRMVWFPKISAISQAIFTFPVIGFISGYQGIIIFGLGLPALFITIHATGAMHYGAGMFVAFLIFAMIRPPVISYEGRLYAILRFYMRDRIKNRKVKKYVKKSRALSIPSSSLQIPKKAIPKHILKKPKKLTVFVSANKEKLTSISITLKNRNNAIMPNKKVRLLLDDIPIRTSISSGSGIVSTILEYEDCIGTRTLAVSEVTGSDDAGKILVKREIEFVRTM